MYTVVSNRNLGFPNAPPLFRFYWLELAGVMCRTRVCGLSLVGYSVSFSFTTCCQGDCLMPADKMLEVIHVT